MKTRIQARARPHARHRRWEHGARKPCLAHTARRKLTRGFLREDFADDGITHNADGFRQNRHTERGCISTATSSPRCCRRAATLARGMDYLYGYGAQTSDNFEYGIFPDGRNPPVSINLHTDEVTLLNDRRSFAGVYGDWRFDVNDAWRIDAGLRYNHTSETRYGQSTDMTGPVPDTEGESSRHGSNRLSGMLGSSLQLWKDGSDEVVAYANTTAIPSSRRRSTSTRTSKAVSSSPKTAHSGEFGFKGSNLRRPPAMGCIGIPDALQQPRRQHGCRRRTGTCQCRQRALPRRRIRDEISSLGGRLPEPAGELPRITTRASSMTCNWSTTRPVQLRGNQLEPVAAPPAPTSA